MDDQVSMPCGVCKVTAFPEVGTPWSANSNLGGSAALEGAIPSRVKASSTPYLLLFLCMAAVVPVRGQGRVADPGDCIDAIFIKDSIITCDRPVRGFGNVLEIKENPSSDLKWLEREHNTVWYLFRAPVTGPLTFDIIPHDVEDDLDFLLFQGNVPDFCEKVRTKQVVPVRSNISRNDRALNSMCGLSKEASDDHVRSGVGSSYSRALDVVEGDMYYLLVDYPQRPRAGFTVHFHYPAPPQPPPAPEKPQTLIVSVVDSASGAPLQASISIEGMRFDSIVQAKGQSRYEFNMDNYRNLRINCLRQGYMFRSQRVKPSGDALVEVEVALVPIKPGTKVVLDDIRFVGNDSKVLRNSEGSLYMLLHFMEQNPTARIEIQGHVNGPSVKKKMNTELVELSTERAQTVFNFLLVNDIDPSRLAYVGLGNAHMLYPEPRNKAESEANRRVEVRITAYDQLATPSAPSPRRPSH